MLVVALVSVTAREVVGLDGGLATVGIVVETGRCEEPQPAQSQTAHATSAAARRLRTRTPSSGVLYPTISRLGGIAPDNYRGGRGGI